MKPRWKIVLTLSVPVLLIVGGVYFRLVVGSRYDKQYAKDYYRNEAQPAISALNADRKNPSLTDAERMLAMQKMMQHAQNLESYAKSNRQKRMMAFIFWGLSVGAAGVFVVGRLDKKNHDA